METNADPKKLFPDVNEEDLDPDLIISEEEQRAFELFIQQKKQQLEDTQRRYKKWMGDFTRRRMIALAKLKKLERNSKKRLQFFDHMKRYFDNDIPSDSIQHSTMEDSVQERTFQNRSPREDDMNAPDSVKSSESRNIFQAKESSSVGRVLESLEESEEILTEENVANLDSVQIESVNNIPSNSELKNET